MTSPVRALWDAPAAQPPPPRRVWRDWALVGALPPLILIEAALRGDVPGRWLWAVVLIALVPALLWRRVQPLAALALALIAGTLVGLASPGEPELFTTAYFLILVYALMRWGSGRAVVVGAALLIAGSTLSFIAGPGSLEDVVGGIAVLVATSTLGLTFRWRASARSRELDSVRLLEREQLARDLHDTVAHHVSAIAIQAQAGTAVAADDPAAALGVLAVIEREASRTLDEMRSMVRLLRRDDDEAERTPTPGIADLDRLARDDAALPARVRIDGDVAEVPLGTSAAIFRIGQESVTNARRHARGATRVDVAVRIEDGFVYLDVTDDGEPSASRAPGYGIPGMAERVGLLGGNFAAGPSPHGGWAVTAALPMPVGPR